MIIRCYVCIDKTTRKHFTITFIGDNLDHISNQMKSPASTQFETILNHLCNHPKYVASQVGKACDNGSFSLLELARDHFDVNILANGG